MEPTLESSIPDEYKCIDFSKISLVEACNAVEELNSMKKHFDFHLCTETDDRFFARKNAMVSINKLLNQFPFDFIDGHFQRRTLHIALEKYNYPSASVDIIKSIVFLDLQTEMEKVIEKLKALFNDMRKEARDQKSNMKDECVKSVDESATDDGDEQPLQRDFAELVDCGVAQSISECMVYTCEGR